jgi:SET domain-containing protein
MNDEKRRHVIKRTGSSSGLGFFTLVAVPKDKRIVEYVGPILTREETAGKSGRYLMQLDDEYFIDGSPRSNAARYINHSCRPNAKAYRTGVRVWIWSIRDIEAGEEITYDYGKKYFKDFIEPVGCKCEKCLNNLSF